jgi:hypothetical protein
MNAKRFLRKKENDKINKFPRDNGKFVQKQQIDKKLTNSTAKKMKLMRIRLALK